MDSYKRTGNLTQKKTADLYVLAAERSTTFKNLQSLDTKDRSELQTRGYSEVAWEDSYTKAKHEVHRFLTHTAYAELLWTGYKFMYFDETFFYKIEDIN